MFGIIEDNFSAEGIENIHFIVWIGIGILAIVGYLIYIPKKRKQERIKEYSQSLQQKNYPQLYQTFQTPGSFDLVFAISPASPSPVTKNETGTHIGGIVILPKIAPAPSMILLMTAAITTINGNNMDSTRKNSAVPVNPSMKLSSSTLLSLASRSAIDLSRSITFVSSSTDIIKEDNTFLRPAELVLRI
jgi:hypothetical protein